MRPRHSFAIAVAVAFTVAAPRAVMAHQASLTHSEVTVEGAEVRYSLLAAPGDLHEALGMASGDVPDDAQLRAGAAALIAYATARIEVLDRDVPCPAEGGEVDVIDDGGRFARLRWVARCPSPVEELVIEYELFFDLDQSHEAVLRVHAAGDEADTVLREAASRFVWELSEPPPSGLGAFVRSGIDHILFGFDHICFLLTLLLVIVIVRPADGTWRRRSFVDALRATAVIVTAFTLAHSITLIAASLGYVSVPAQVVESVIALSIAYTAVENIVRPDARWRYALTFGFGLLHGLGFARMLEVLLPPEHVVGPLLAFNVGVELGQLAIVALALPVFWLAAGALGAERYRRLVVPALSSLLALLGAVWLIERLVEVTLLGL